MKDVGPPMSLLAELTHRCPLQCPYCSNPLDLERREAELRTEDWIRVLDEAADLGVLQVHFSGGEPMARSDLSLLVGHATARGLYSNLITSGVLLDRAALDRLAAAGLEHVQLSFQDVDAASAERIGGMRGAQARKLEAARLVAAEGIPLTLNFVIHRQNCARVPDMLALAHACGARRVEIAHTQYAGWGQLNRAALLPDRAQFEAATRAVADGRARYGDAMAIDYVTPDYHATQPKPCMGGWGQRFLNVTPSGRVLPCHAAETIPGLVFPSVRETSLRAAWEDSPAFGRFRGTDWMAEPCRSCSMKEVDWGGCRCQALALAGDAALADPVCVHSAGRVLVDAALAERPDPAPPFRYRRMRAGSS
jgi:PqqA peptide cyclase